jgi:hypothetical protein
VWWDDVVVTVDPPTPTSYRPSARERERTVDRLRVGLDQERISLNTYADRLDGAFGARSRAQLDELIADLPARGGLGRALQRLASAASGLSARIERGWADARAPRMRLPQSTITVGRARDCDCVVSDMTVSRRHARIDVRDGGWFVSDLRSANGTLVNGWRVVDEVTVRPGDRLTFGAMTYRLGPPLRA